MGERWKSPIDPDDNMMKILVSSYKLISSYYGGGEIYIRNLIAGLSGRGHHVIGMSLAFTNVQEPQRLWFRHDIFEEVQLSLPKGWMIGSHENHEDSRVQRELTLLLKEIAPDVIHANGWKQDISFAARKAGIECVVTAHHGGIVCPAGALLNHRDEICTLPVGQDTCRPCIVQSVPGGKLWMPFLHLIPLDVQLCLGRWLRARRFLYFVTPLGTLALSIREKLAAIETLGRYATHLIAPSPAIRDALVRNGIPSSKVAVVPHGIPLSQRQRLRPDLGNRPVRFLYVGRISNVKGVHILLEAFAGLPPEMYELHIVGGAVTKPEQRYIAKLKRRYASVVAVWHGSRSHEEIPQHLAACDVMVHPAICLEVFGLTIAEALAVGRPVIATRCGGAEAQIRDGENGLLVPPNDAMALRQALQAVIDDPARIQAMAAQAGDVVSIQQHVQDLKNVYNMGTLPVR